MNKSKQKIDKLHGSTICKRPSEQFPNICSILPSNLKFHFLLIQPIHTHIEHNTKGTKGYKEKKRRRKKHYPIKTFPVQCGRNRWWWWWYRKKNFIKLCLVDLCYHWTMASYARIHIRLHLLVLFFHSKTLSLSFDGISIREEWICRIFSTSTFFQHSPCGSGEERKTTATAAVKE